MKQLTKFLLLGFVFFALVFGATQIFVDDAEALIDCGYDIECTRVGDRCIGGTSTCYCNTIGDDGGPFAIYSCLPWIL